jgi:histidine ammonia-lyase
MNEQVVLDGNSLSVDQVVAVANGARVALAGDAIRKMDSSRAHVDAIVGRAGAVYGINTGFGKFSDIVIPADRIRELQINLIRSHCAGVGEPLPEREVRAMMLLRANVLAKGLSGARPQLPRLLSEMLNAGLWPQVPEQGSVGASGDLAPLAHLALTLIGEGTLSQHGNSAAAGEMLRSAGLTPIILEAKEGLALINGTQCHTAIGCLALHDAFTIWRSTHAAGAATLEALLGTPTAFEEEIHRARGQRGQLESAALLRALLSGSEIRESHRSNDPRVQDAYSLRCMPQVLGPVKDALQFCATLIGTELNAATDNPLVLHDGRILSGGNFHGQVVAMALDLMGIVLSNVATMSERRIDRLLHPDLNQGLPPFLSPDPGLHSGYMMAQVTAAALASECKLLAHPASVDSIPTDGGQEDVVPMAMGAAVKTRRMVRNVQRVIAIELLCAAQGLENRRPLKPGRGVERAYRIVRSHVPALTADKVIATDIELLAHAVARGEFVLPEVQA